MLEELLHDKIAAISHVLKKERQEKGINNYEYAVQTISDRVITAEWPDGNSDLTESPSVSVATIHTQSFCARNAELSVHPKRLKYKLSP